MLREVRATPHQLSAELETQSHEARAVFQGLADDYVWQQGYELAREMRGRLPGGEATGWLDVGGILLRLGVEVRDIEIAHPVLDAVAVWGPRHGPVVLVNRRGLHARTEPGKRATLAHELCHLLVDRHRTLPLADAVGGRAPRLTEARANAFAAELLLPREAIRHHARDAALDAKSCLALFRRYGVSRQLGGWQVRNSDVPVSAALQVALTRWTRGQS